MEDQRLVKTVMFEMVEGFRHRGRPPRIWPDDITGWCAMHGCSLRYRRLYIAYYWRTTDNADGGVESLASTAQRATWVIEFQSREEEYRLAHNAIC